MEIKISQINDENFNPFGATEEELVANALNEAGLATRATKINDFDLSQLCSRYYDKRQMFRTSTRMGNILVKHKMITPEQLHKALLHQKKHPDQKFGDALVALDICDASKINEFLSTQSRIRRDIKEMGCYINNLSPIKDCLNSYQC